jgi:perosamine synthetase
MLQNVSKETGWISSEVLCTRNWIYLILCESTSQVNTANGSAALDIAVKAFGIKQRRWGYNANVYHYFSGTICYYCGSYTVLVDSDPVTWNMDVTQIEGKNYT